MDDVDQKIDAAFYKFWLQFRRDVLDFDYTQEEELIAKVAFVAGVKHLLEVLNETARPEETTIKHD